MTKKEMAIDSEKSARMTLLTTITLTVILRLIDMI